MVQALLHCMDMVRASQPGAPFLPLLAPNNRLETSQNLRFQLSRPQTTEHPLACPLPPDFWWWSSP